VIRLPSFKTQAAKDEYYDAKKELERAQAHIQACDDNNRRHGGYDRELSAAVSRFRAAGGSA
jgi:hypothetical protein